MGSLLSYESERLLLTRLNVCHAQFVLVHDRWCTLALFSEQASSYVILNPKSAVFGCPSVASPALLRAINEFLTAVLLALQPAFANSWHS